MRESAVPCHVGARPLTAILRESTNNGASVTREEEKEREREKKSSRERERALMHMAPCLQIAVHSSEHLRTAKFKLDELLQSIIQ